MPSELELRAGRLLERLLREKERGPLRTAIAGDTAAVGGWSKIGQCVESLLAAVFDEVVSMAGEDAYRLKRDMNVARRPTAGSWIEATLGFVRARQSSTALSPIAASIYRDLLSERTSAVRRLIEVRNSLVHAGEKAPTPAEAHRALDAAIGMLRRAGV